MTEQVVYEVNMKGNLSEGITKATESAKGLGSSLESVKGVLESLGIGFGLYKIGEFISESREAFEKLEQSRAQVEAGLVSTAHAAGLTSDELSKMADEMDKKFKFSKAEVTDMQAVMLTFPGITKRIFGDASQAVLDLSTRMHKGLDESAVMIGKALQDPTKGVTALRRIGVNFNETQTEVIKKLVATGQAAKAQALILQELQKEFAGSAEAAANADPLFAYNKAMENTSLTVGEAASKLLTALTPALIQFLDWVKKAVEWGTKHWQVIKEVTLALGAAFIAFKTASTIIAGYSALMEGLAVSEAAAATATEGFAAASATALGPIAAIAAAVGGLVLIYQELADNVKVAKDEMDKMSSANAAGENDLIKSLIDAKKEGGMTEKQATGYVVSDQVFKLTQQIKAQQSEVDNLYKNLTAWQKATGGEQDKYNEKVKTLSSLRAQLSAAESYGQTNLVPKTKATTAATDITKVKDKTRATGTKSVTINVKIQELIGIKEMKTTNINQSMTNLKKALTEVMTGAVNDFQIVAGE